MCLPFVLCRVAGDVISEHQTELDLPRPCDKHVSPKITPILTISILLQAALKVFPRRSFIIIIINVAQAL